MDDEASLRDRPKTRPLARPDGYHDNYKSVKFGDGSKLTSGPVLSEKGEEKFTQDKSDDEKYQYIEGARNLAQPGVLRHAGDPNPRSGISVPNGTSSDDAYRLAVGITPPDQRNRGFTMPEWSKVMSRLDRLNGKGKEGSSVNLDGGGSSALGVVNSEGEKLLDVRQDKGRPASTLISFSSGSETKPPDNRAVALGKRKQPEK